MPLYCSVQPGFEDALATEVLDRYPGSQLREALPGWRVFALAAGNATEKAEETAIDGAAPSRFARSWGQLLGRGTRPWESGAHAPLFAAPFHFQAWSRKHSVPGARERNPVLIDVQLKEPELRRAMRDARLPVLGAELLPRPGEPVVSLIRVAPADWAWSYHRHAPGRIAHPGGEHPWPPHAVPSRAYLKCQEAVEWSGEELLPGQQAVELGCAPGGAAQALLERGIQVMGVDPAPLAPEVEALAARKGLELAHHRCLAEKLDPSCLPARIDWLFSDMNVHPRELFALLETWRPVLRDRGVRALFLTLKLTERALIGELGAIEARLRSEWGWRRAECRQLSSHRREILLYAAP